MSAALTVQPRHLDLPLGALFRPEELIIAPSTTRAEYQALGAGLSKLAMADKLWQCDFALWGMKSYGADEGLRLAREATGLSAGLLERCARIAERFDPPRRIPGLTREHYRGLCCFPVSFTDEWLPAAARKGLSAKALRNLAVHDFGSDPKGAYSKNKKRSVSISPVLWAQISQHAPNKVSCFIQRILSEWLEQHPDAPNQTVGVAPSDGNEPAATSRHPETSAATETPRPDYETRRKQAINAGAQPIPAKERKYTSKVKIVFTECRGNSFIESKYGQLNKFSAAARADRFFKLEKAEAAAREYSADRRYTVFPALCENCSTAHKPVWHVFRDKPEQKEAPAEAGA